MDDLFGHDIFRGVFRACHASITKFFCQNSKWFLDVIFAKNPIIGVWHSFKYTSGMLAVNCLSIT